MSKFPLATASSRNEQHPHVALVRQRLAAQSAEGGKDDVYDQSLAEAVKAFQKAHDLKPNGVIDRKLRAALNEVVADTPDSKRWRILANMEKWRWMPDDLGEFYVWNNIPEQLTRVFENGKLVHDGKDRGRKARHANAELFREYAVRHLSSGMERTRRHQDRRTWPTASKGERVQPLWRRQWFVRVASAWVARDAEWPRGGRRLGGLVEHGHSPVSVYPTFWRQEMCLAW